MRHPGDTVPNTFIGSLGAMQPRDSIGLCTVYLEQLKEWLSNAEGPDLIEGTERLQNQMNSLAWQWASTLYITTLPRGRTLWWEWVWSSNLLTSPWCLSAPCWQHLWIGLLNLKERMSEACLTFLNVSPESEVYPLCKDYPVLVDLISQELVSSHFMRSWVTNFHAFKLPFVCGTQSQI